MTPRILLAVMSTVALATTAACSGQSTDDNSATTPDPSTNPTQAAEPAVTYDLAAIAPSEYYGEYSLAAPAFGTETSVTLSGTERTMSTNAIPNHDTGQFPNDGNPNTISTQDVTATFPLQPTLATTPTDARETGRAVNGVKYEPGTNERATCGDGTVVNVEAKQDHASVGLDHQNAHVQPTGEYHYHGIPKGLVDEVKTDADLVHVGWAHDGHAMFVSQSNAYKSSYQLKSDREHNNCTWTSPDGSNTVTFPNDSDGSFTQDYEYVENGGQLDECNGVDINGQYAYLLTEEFPYVPRCLKGTFASQGGPDQGGPPPGAP